MSVRGVPVQDLLENQDESVLYVTDEVTKVVRPLTKPAAEPAPKRRGRPKRVETDDFQAETVTFKEATPDAAVQSAPEGEGE